MRFSDLEGRRVALWGAGAEIQALLAAIRARGLEVEYRGCIFDQEPGEKARAALARYEIEPVPAAEAVNAVAGADALIRSPGVSIHRPEIEEVIRRGVEVTTPTGLMIAERQGRRIIGVTGTKGKSTTTTLIATLLKAQEVEVAVGGNIGRPAIELLDEPADRWAVFELSSYQVADLEYGTEVAVVTNLYREHLDWHLTHDYYHREKLRLFGLPGTRAAVVGSGDEKVRQAAAAAGIEQRLFGTGGSWYVEEGVVMRAGEPVAQAGELPLRGTHNLVNLCAALVAIEAAGLEAPRDLAAALEGFEGLPHRLNIICEAEGITWVDDSISTTVESAIAAIESFPDRPVVLIGGGQDRGQDYTALGEILAARSAGLVCLPDTGSRLKKAALDAGVGYDRVLLVEDMDGAVAAARLLAEPDAVVLLSPAAPSYNAYRSFKERGDEFSRIVTRQFAPGDAAGDAPR